MHLLIANVQEKCEVRLWIIGNGFDLFHGLHTRYLDYKAYICQHDPHRRGHCVKKPEDLPREVCENCCKIKNDNCNCPVRKFYDLPRGEMKEDLWRDLEESCTIDLCRLLKPLKGWVKTKRNSLGESGAEILAHGCLDFMSVFAGNYLYDWLKDVEKSELSGKGSNDQAIDIEGSDVFLTFNYTNTLRQIYSIPEDQILHVHGSLADVGPECKKFAKGIPSLKSGRVIHSCLAFGSPEMTDDALDVAIERFRKSQKLRTREVGVLRSEMSKLIKLLNKDVESNVEKVKMFVCKRFRDVTYLDEVVIAGHSLGRIDAPYFDFLSDYLRDVKWRFIYHSEDDLKKALGFCKRYHLNGYYMPWETARKSCYAGVKCCVSNGLPCPCSKKTV